MYGEQTVCSVTTQPPRREAAEATPTVRIRPFRLKPPLTLTRLEEAAFGWLLLLGIEAARAQPQVDALFGARLLSVHTNRSEVLEKLDCRKRHVALQARTEIDGTRGVVRLVVPSLAVE